MNDYPLKHEVTIFEPFYTTDDLGNEIPTYDKTNGQTIKVFAWSINNGAEVKSGDVNRVEYDGKLYFNTADEIEADYRVDIPNIGIFEVIGPPLNWNNNPWFVPSMSIAFLRRITG